MQNRGSHVKKYILIATSALYTLSHWEEEEEHFIARPLTYLDVGFGGVKKTKGLRAKHCKSRPRLSVALVQLGRCDYSIQCVRELRGSVWAARWTVSELTVGRQEMNSCDSVRCNFKYLASGGPVALALRQRVFAVQFHWLASG